MEPQEAPAAGQGGNPNTSPSQDDVEHAHSEPDEGFESDEVLRRRAATYMTQHLESATFLIGRCEHLALHPKGDRMRPLYAAAQLMRANAQVAQTLGQLAQVERRRRTIVERIQPSALILKDSNSSFADSKSNPEGVLIDDVLLTMLRYMKLIADEKLGPVLKEAAENAREEENSAATAETSQAPA